MANPPTNVRWPAAISALVLAMGLSGCQAECSVSTARLSDAKMASAINADTKEPTTLASTFAPGTPAIYATAKLSNAPDGTKVKASFHYLESGDRQIAEDEVQAGGTRFVAFTLTAPTSGWPAGQYETRFYLNGKESLRLPFNVAATAAPAMPPTAPPAAEPGGKPSSSTFSSQPKTSPPAQAAMKRFSDATFGISFELPSSWTYRLTPARDYLLEGPKGTDAFELSIVLQFVAKAANPGSSPVAQAQGIAEQLSRAPNGAIKTRDTVTVAGREAPFFVATYTAANSAGAATPFAHTQIVIDHGAYYYLISYSGPVPIYQKHIEVFQNLVQTLRLTS